jgi:hypothetical protein
MAKRFAVRFALVVLMFSLAGILSAATPKAPGKYQEWGPDIDEVEVLQSFRFSDYANVVIEPLGASSTLPAPDADLVDVSAKVVANATPPFLAGVKKVLPSVTVAAGEPPARTLIVRTKITLMDPGSRAKRMWIGYGAGAARTAIEGEVVDGATGKVLVRFVQERRSGIERFGRGSSYEEIMKRNLTALGQDAGELLKEF